VIASPLRALALAAGAVLPIGCIASNVLAPQQRLVAGDPEQLPWFAADAAAIDGLFESIDIRGDAAVSLRRIWYVFARDGTYTGAALAENDGTLAFQTLSGTWSLTADGLVLDGQTAVACESAVGHLRLSAPNGVVVLKKGSLQ
jgi:hypothetical protein